MKLVLARVKTKQILLAIQKYSITEINDIWLKLLLDGIFGSFPPDKVEDGVLLKVQQIHKDFRRA